MHLQEVVHVVAVDIAIAEVHAPGEDQLVLRTAPIPIILKTTLSIS